MAHMVSSHLTATQIKDGYSGAFRGRALGDATPLCPNKKFWNKKWPILNQKIKILERGTAPCPDPYPSRRGIHPLHTQLPRRLKPHNFGVCPSPSQNPKCATGWSHNMHPSVSQILPTTLRTISHWLGFGLDILHQWVFVLVVFVIFYVCAFNDYLSCFQSMLNIFYCALL